MAQKEDRRLNSIIGGKWRVDRVLGTGSMATVYAVTHRNGVHAALKILHPTLCTDPKVCERFLGEGYLTNAVKHPGIVRVLDDGMTDDGCVFLVMDLLEGKTLEILRQDRGGRLDVDEALDIADSLMDTLHAVHRAGIIHRDLKPQNVFICNDGSVKLLDFGVARVLENAASKSKMSLFGMVLGTPSFMSPEQAIGARDQVDHRADVYSLGATIFTALTGETVHLGPHVQAKLLAAGTVQARSISIVKQDLPMPISNVIDTALRFDKNDRWQSVDAFRRALREARKASMAKATAKATGAEPKKPLQIIDKGPTRTFIGIGGSDSGKLPAEPPAHTTSRDTLPFGADPHPGRTGAAKTLPLGIIRNPIAIEEEATLDEEEEDDQSYPASGVHTPMPTYDEADALMSQLEGKRSNLGFVAASLALIAAAIGGVAFYAMGGHASTNTANADETSVTAAAPATLTSAAAPASSPELAAPSTTTTTSPRIAPVAGDKKETADAGAPGSSVHPPAHAAITPPPAWHPAPSRPPAPPRAQQTFTPVPQSNSTPNPANQTSFPRLPANPEPPPASSPAPTATPSVSSDPFSTPE